MPHEVELTVTYEIATPAQLSDAAAWIAGVRMMYDLAIPRTEWNPATQTVGTVALHFQGEVLSEDGYELRIGEGGVTFDLVLATLEAYRRGMVQGAPVPLRQLTIVLPAEEGA